MDDLTRRLKSSPRAEGQGRIYIHGEKEWKMEEERHQKGIPLHPKVVALLDEIAEELHLPPPLDKPVGL